MNLFCGFTFFLFYSSVIHHSKGWKAAHALRTLAFCLISETFVSVYYTYRKEELRPLVKHLIREARKGDVLYMNSYSQYAFSYYWALEKKENPFYRVFKLPDDLLIKDNQPCSAMRYIHFEPNKNEFFIWRESETKPFSAILAPRAWFLFNGVGPGLETYLIQNLNKIGVQRECIEDVDTKLYLYYLNSSLPEK